MPSDELVEKYKEQIKEAIEDLKTPGRRHKQIPNILTLSRMFSPFIIIPNALLGNSEEAMKLAAFFGLTDLVDGYIARKFNLSSPLGADLDALTDKLFAGTLLLTGAVSNPYLLANTGLEMVIAGVNLKQKFSGNKSGSTIMGKVKTGAVFTLGGLSVAATSVQELDKVIFPLAISTAILQTMTLVSYLKKYNDNNQLPPQTNNLELLEKLREESAFLHQEIENKKNEEKPSNYQKVKA